MTLRLPLSREEFAAALVSGHGRALMHVERHGLGEFEDELLRACVTDFVLDGQTEERRAPWLARIVAATGDAPRWGAALADALDAVPEGDDAAQVCELLVELSRRGVLDPREALRRAVDRWAGADGTGWDELLELDGVAGVLHVARARGGAILGGTAAEGPSEDFFVDEASERLGEETVRAALAEAATTDAAPRAFLARVETQRSTAAAQIARRRNPPAATYAAWRAEALGQESSASAGRFAAKAPDDEIRRAFDGMLGETDPGPIRLHLRIFLSRTFPAFDERLLAWAVHEDPRVHHMTRHALGRLADPRVRAFALPRFVDPPPDEDRVALLTALSASYEPGDAAAVEPALPATGDAALLHSLVDDVTNLAKSQADPALAGCLLWAYAMSRCEFGRADAVEELRRRGASPAWIEEEIAFDAFERVRKLGGGGAKD